MLRQLIFLGCCLAAATGCGAAELTVRLDFRPLTEKLATWVELAPDGSAQVLSYSPQSLEIVRAFRGKPVSAALPGLAERLWNAIPVAKQPDSLVHDDLFQLSLLREDGSLRMLSGPWGDSPPDFRRDVRLLLGLVDSLAEDADTSFFLKIEPLTDQQMRRLRSGGRYPLHPAQELPPFLRALLAPSATFPQFCAIGEEDYAALQKKSQSARLIYVDPGETHGSTGFEISVYLKANSSR